MNDSVIALQAIFMVVCGVHRNLVRTLFSLVIGRLTRRVFE